MGIIFMYINKMATKKTDEEVNWADFISDSESDNEEAEVKYVKPKTSTKQKSNRIADEIMKQEKYIDSIEGPVIELFLYNMEYETTEMQLKQFFGIQEVKRVFFDGFRINSHDGSALIQFTTKNAAKQALLKDGATFNNRKVFVYLNRDEFFNSDQAY